MVFSVKMIAVILPSLTCWNSWFSAKSIRVSRSSSATALTVAYWSVYLLVGYEQTTLERDPKVYKVIADQMCDDLEAGRFTGVPPT